MDLNLANLRREYLMQKLNEEDIDINPFQQFENWFNAAQKIQIPDANALCLSTSNKLGRCSSRIVLLKHYSEEGFIFFTNYNSRKGREIRENPYASLLFYWQQLERQVRIEGKIRKTNKKTSDTYFEQRPDESKISAWASPQSEIIPGRSYLDKLEKEYRLHFNDKPMKRPENWGGYILVPDYFEFWQGRENRLHDRISFSLEKTHWQINRLAP